eukprot:Rhum_TRINITY_DN17316_c0_g1::Rhum_TRINITY_DN17316_c0_g1_i1::g.165753::m.165753
MRLRVAVRSLQLARRHSRQDLGGVRLPRDGEHDVHPVQRRRPLPCRRSVLLAVRLGHPSRRVVEGERLLLRRQLRVPRLRHPQRPVRAPVLRRQRAARHHDAEHGHHHLRRVAAQRLPCLQKRPAHTGKQLLRVLRHLERVAFHRQPQRRQTRRVHRSRSPPCMFSPQRLLGAHTLLAAARGLRALRRAPPVVVAAALEALFRRPLLLCCHEAVNLAQTLDAECLAALGTLRRIEGGASCCAQRRVLGFGLLLCWSPALQSLPRQTARLVLLACPRLGCPRRPLTVDSTDACSPVATALGVPLCCCLRLDVVYLCRATDAVAARHPRRASNRCAGIGRSREGECPRQGRSSKEHFSGGTLGQSEPMKYRYCSFY